MDDKKHPERFTIAFNLSDTRQRAASEELRRHGRHKARFITDAILCYTQGQMAETGANAPVDEIVKRCVDAVLQNLHVEPPAAETPTTQRIPAPTAGEPQWDSEDLSVIAGTLSAFQK